jgi:mannose-6-phosphate isomerase-like protein (cupin superfamily)
MSEPRYFKQNNPNHFPTEDGKTILEHFGAITGNSDVSIAHMIAPAGWGEPHQNPGFDEYTLMVSGKKQIEVDGEVIVLNAGESILVRKGARVRYSNPFGDDAVYWSVCIPAFSVETVNRED